MERRGELIEAIRTVLAKGGYQMVGDVLPYETQARAVAEVVEPFIAAVTPDPTAEDSPEMREVPVNEVRGGDTVTVSFTAHAEHIPGAAGLWLSEFEGGNAPSMFLTQDDVTVTRPVSPLPDKPGAVGTATVRGVKGVRVMRIESGAWP